MAQDKPPYVVVEDHHHWLELTLNQPGSFNALSEEMMQALQVAINQANLNSDCLL